MLNARPLIEQSIQRLKEPSFGLGNALFSLAGIGTLALIAWHVGGFTKFFALFLAVYTLMVWYWFWKCHGLADSDQAAIEQRLARNGRVLATGLYMLLALYAYWRISGATAVLSLVGAWAFLGWWVIRPIIMEGPQTQRIMMRFFVISISILVGWVVSSLAYDPLTIRFLSPADSTSLPAAFETRRQVKQSEAKDVRVGLTLSGGGYRAASIHAGVLKALDEHRIPVDYLSTVSGGSIIGSYYALGHSPEEFQRLLQVKPGLPNHLFNLPYLFGELFTPWWRDSDSYASHFRHIYFGGAKLADVQIPRLLVNVTDYQTGEREVLSSDSSLTKDIAIADAVAASGAFPGAFEPKTIGNRHFIDGGVVDNLGLEGLRKYLLGSNQKPELDILIISDASKGPQPKEPGKKEFRLTLLQEASSHSYDALHLHLYRLYSDNGYEPEALDTLAQPYYQNMSHVFGQSGNHQEHLFVFILDGTSLAEREYMAREGKLAGDRQRAEGNVPVISEETASAVADFGTLEELSSVQLARGFWVGETIARHYADAIKCVLRELQDSKAAHQTETDPAEVVLSCGGPF